MSRAYTHKNTPAKGPVPCTEGQESLFTDIYGLQSGCKLHIQHRKYKRKENSPMQTFFLKKKKNIEVVVQ